MAIPQLLSAQRDFSAGELDAELKRHDDLPVQKAGGRQMANWRILSSDTLRQRPGRRALYLQSGRVDQVAVSPTLTYDLCFGSDGSWVIRNSAGAVVAGQPASTYAWAGSTIDQIVWSKVNVSATRTDVVVTFPGQAPTLAIFNNGAWSFAAFAFATDQSGTQLVPYYRVAAPGATMKPSATAAAGASVSIEFSENVLAAGHVGTLFRFAGRRLRFTGVADPQHGTATAIDAFLKTQELTLIAPDGALSSGIEGFSVGQVVRGSASEAEGEVVNVNIGTGKVVVQITNYASGFIVSAVGPPAITELLVGPSAKAKVSAVTDVLPLPAVSWDEQMISDVRGWPRSCFTDAQRLGFCDLPSTSEAVLWSVTGSPYNFTVGAEATDAIVELIAGKPRVYHVGPWIDEIVFTDQGLFYVPINTTNPLKPGSVTFQRFSPEAASSVKPLFTSDGYLFVNEGRNSVKAIVATGAAFSTRPYGVEDITRLHKHLFASGPKALALSTGDGQVPERYIYVVNTDGSVATGKYEAGKQWIGWVPWNGSGTVTWISALHAAVRFVSMYPVGVTTVSLGEVLDEDQYVDGAILINAPPASMGTPPGHGAFWWLPGGTVDLIDGVRPMGAHTIDANGYIVPAYEGEVLDVATITAGLPFTPIFEPFIPNAQPGQDVKQRTIRRSVGRLVVSVKDSTGFVMASLYSGKAGPNLPAQGAVVNERRIPPWDQGDDQAAAPTLNESTYRQRFSGRAFDPRVAVLKDQPGPLHLVEVAIEASV